MLKNGRCGPHTILLTQTSLLLFILSTSKMRKFHNHGNVLLSYLINLTLFMQRKVYKMRQK